MGGAVREDFFEEPDAWQSWKNFLDLRSYPANVHGPRGRQPVALAGKRMANLQVWRIGVMCSSGRRQPTACR